MFGNHNKSFKTGTGFQNEKMDQRLNENEVYEEEGFNCDTILSYVKTHDPKLQWTVLVFLTIVEKPVTFSFYGCDIEVTFE